MVNCQTAMLVAWIEVKPGNPHALGLTYRVQGMGHDECRHGGIMPQASQPPPGLNLGDRHEYLRQHQAPASRDPR